MWLRRRLVGKHYLHKLVIKAGCYTILLIVFFTLIVVIFDQSFGTILLELLCFEIPLALFWWLASADSSKR